MRDFRQCKGVHFMHMRKAGGTSLRKFIKQVCISHKIPFHATEGKPLNYGALEDDTFLVTNFRNPLERIFSLYNAEGVYPIQANGKHVPLDLWLDQETAIQTRILAPLWRHNSNFHVRTLSDSGSEHRSYENLRKREIKQSDYRSAVLNLQRIDLPVILEWLDNPSYLRHLTNRLLGPDSSSLKVPTLNRTAARQSFDIRPSITPAQNNYLLESNRWDIELYRFACWIAGNALAEDNG